MENQETLTIIFAKALMLGAGENATPYEQVELREPTAGELEKASRADTQIGVVINLISSVGRIPRGVAEKIGQRDLSKASAFFGTFSDAGQPVAEAGQS